MSRHWLKPEPSRPPVGRSLQIPLTDETKKTSLSVGLFFMVAGVGFEPHDLQVMSLASYRTALPRDRCV